MGIVIPEGHVWRSGLDAGLALGMQRPGFGMDR